MSSVSALNSLLGSSDTSTNSAIDLSAILQAATGSASTGIDVNEAVSSAVTAAEAPEQLWEDQQTTLQNQASALTQLQTSATTLDNDAQALNSLTGAFSGATVSSSNSSIVTGSATSASAAENDVVVVNSLATTASWASTSVSSESVLLPPETFTITTASGGTATITTGNGINTLSDLENAINGENLGLNASIITDANGSRLAITADASGSAGNFTVTSSDPSSTFSFSQAVAGNNASLTVNGLAISSASNTVSGVISGLTLNLLSASPDTEVSLTVAPDASQAETAINQFVTDYNTLIGQLNSQFADTVGSGQGVLADDPTVEGLQNALLQTLDYSAAAPGASIPTSLASFGITVNKDGTLSVNSSTLDDALQNNYSGVQSFFQGTALNGFANTLDQQLTNFISPANGAFTVDLQSLNTQYTDLQTDISNFQTNVIAPLKTQLQSEFSQAEIALQQLPEEIKNVDAELGMNNNNSNS